MPRVRDVDRKSGRRYNRFRIDVRINEEKYRLFKKECESLHITPSAKVRELISQWIEKQMNNNGDSNNQWKTFIEKMKAEGFETPEEWVRAKLGL